ncbi:M3 family metallopeptidase [Mangrovimonas sp. YM274]|uniref:M3 family metallopeptidase n=1 Tax=Mangrovimonas sp. YM274 TaxID=3070660 RepID=UPI0027DE652E|nr:M3 family metallopeptidase [Mangrovimonas sp. YM274]WMI67682.1 M3 family metallopeptidase [Mangrovimonas sp. YM274]
MKTTFYSLFTLLLLMGCANNTKTEQVQLKTLSENNPFNVKLNVPIDYASVDGAAIEEYVATTIDNVVTEVEAIKAQETPTFENTFVAYDRINSQLSKASNNAFMLYWVSTDSIVRAEGLKGNQKVDSLGTVIGADKLLFDKLETFAASKAYNELQGHRKKMVDDVIAGFKQSGVNLSPENLEKFKTLTAEISDLSSQYSTNMNTANEVLTLSEAETDGLPESFKAQYKQEDGSYGIPVINATRVTMLNNPNSSEVRKAYTIKYDNRGADKNLEILDSLVSKRYQLAQLFGAKSYAEYNLKLKMAKTPETVWNFIDGLVAESKGKAVEDLKVLEAVAAKKGQTVNAWDLGYYKDQILKNEYNVDHEKIREYLPMDACLEGLFTIYQQLLGLEFRRAENASVWSEEVEAYEVFENNKLKGRFYLDLYPRPFKETWFYGVPLTYGRQTAEGYEVPVAMLLGNFTKPTEDMPSLLTYKELSTLFHEFGHIVNSMSYDGEFNVQAQANSDFVEAMSQIFENWIGNYEMLSSFAKHYKTGEVFPKELFDNMKASQNVSSGLNAQSMLRKCIYDMNLYDKYDPANPVNTDEIWKNIDKQMGVMDWYVEGTHPQGSWIHVNTHPTYYYGYLWSEVYAQDMFTLFEKNGLTDQETGVRYRKLILSNGSQRDVVSAVEEFLGRPSNNEAYIKSLGLE